LKAERLLRAANEILKNERGISFEEIAYLINSGQIIGIEENPSRPNQKLYILEIDNYAIIVPYVEKDNEIFLKSAIPSRKYTKRYSLKGKNERSGRVGWNQSAYYLCFSECSSAVRNN
jgi:hypothetical protein